MCCTLRLQDSQVDQPLADQTFYPSHQATEFPLDEKLEARVRAAVYSKSSSNHY